MTDTAWRDDVDALTFQPSGYKGRCFVHRRAFATLLGFTPNPEQCAEYFTQHRAAFEQAAQRKARDSHNFHLTSRDIAREIKAATPS